jgi:hypothetical protein
MTAPLLLKAKFFLPVHVGTPAWGRIRRTTDDAGSLVHMHDLGRRETVEVGAAGGGVGAHVLSVDQFTELPCRVALRPG